MTTPTIADVKDTWTGERCTPRSTYPATSVDIRPTFEPDDDRP